MEEMAPGVDADELMELDEGEGSDLEDEDDESIDDPLPSPFQMPSSEPASAGTSAASSPLNSDDGPHLFGFGGKPLSIKRGRGRPRREGGKPIPRRQTQGVRVRKIRPPGSGRNPPKRAKSFDFDLASITPSPSEEMALLDPETGAFVFPEKEKLVPTPEEPPYAPEQWPGKVCAFCNLSERSQLGQGEMLRLSCPEGFIPRRIESDHSDPPSNCSTPSESGDKSPRGPVTCRRQKSFSKCRHPSVTNEYVEELSVIGYMELPDVHAMFEQTGHFYVHRNCALWSTGVIKNENSALENVGFVLLHSISKKCAHCSHFGASLTCKVDGCCRTFHYPCATASCAFQELQSLTVLCSQHLSLVSSMCDSSSCYVCKILGDIANLMFCSVCGEHYHGRCVGLAQLPGVRAGWQCRKCRICQVCRMAGDETKLMACEQCDKVYHAMCQRPIVTTIPKYGWKCKCCRICGDCGSRTPGAGQSSRWHAHYTVCDSCYQQRNKGFSCPLCRRAYRAHAHREMVQCTMCHKFVHGTCDAEADLVTYQQRKEAHPEYEYVCTNCKNLAQSGRQLMIKRNSIDDPSGDPLPLSQDCPYDENLEFDSEKPTPDIATTSGIRTTGLGKGKPYSASKIAKKRLALTTKPKGTGKVAPEKLGFMKRQRVTEFGRKRVPKSKMRGIFGVPGVGLQRPVSDGGKADDEPGIENRLILCSAKDKFVLTQDICVMCGAIGTDQEGCLIACVQCGQCYHPYCINVKVTKIILQKGWRCLDCTVCEGCGQRNDESRLLLCDDCDISYHIYCMDPPLDYVPQGNWKCKWCAVCQSCGSTDPGFNCSWMNSFTECGPCASHTACASCQEPYSEGELIIQCIQCERWLHGACDSVKTEADAEKCAEEGYNCVLCRPRDVPPPHLLPKTPALKPPTPTKSPEGKANASFCIDGVFLSERGHNFIKSLTTEHQIKRKNSKRRPGNVHDKEAGIMATIESVVAGTSADSSIEDSGKLSMLGPKEEELYREGMEWTKEDGPPPEGFTLYSMENGTTVLRRKRQRNLQKLGIGGFLVRARGNVNKPSQENDDVDGSEETPATAEGEKPRRKPVRRKLKGKLAETYPPYLQEAFFGKELLDSHKEINSSSSDEENAKNFNDKDKTIQLSQEEIKAVAAVSVKRERVEVVGDEKQHFRHENTDKKDALVPKEEDESDTEAFKDVFPGDLLDNDIVNTIMNENKDTLESLTDSNLPEDVEDTSNAKDTKDELSDILGSHFDLESIPNINSKDVEDIFKGVLTDESQESQESNAYPVQSNSVFNTNATQPVHPVNPPVRPTTLPNVQSNLNSPMSFPPQSPYHSEYSNSPQFSPAFSEPPSPWVSVSDPGDLDVAGAIVPSTYNQRSSEKMKADEGLGSGATISAVLYANTNHPEWKTEFPAWNDRYKQIIKKWRTLSSEQKAPYLQKARDNRSALRMKKQQQSQQMVKESGAQGSPKQPPPVAAAVAAVAAPATTPTTAVARPTAVPVSEVCTQQPPTRPATLTTTTSAAASTASSASAKPPPQPSPPPPQQAVHAQFTVHGQFLGAGDLCRGPAPNVTVNPLYHATVHPPPPAPQAPPVPPVSVVAADQQIRVLTPSEIMRTLPSLCQENYDSQPPDQEKIVLQQKSTREAEQERQWKQLQALRQQQAQQQQHVIHEQRVQAIARVQRQISDGSSNPHEPQPPQSMGMQMMTPPHEPPTPVASPSVSRQFLQSAALKSPPFIPKPPTPCQSPQEPPLLPAPIEKPKETPDVYLQSPPTPKPPPPPPLAQGFQPRLPEGSFPRAPPPFAAHAAQLQQAFAAGRQESGGPDINRQLRDLLQKQQQFKKLDGKGQQRIWPPTEAPQEHDNTAVTVHNTEATFRHPLPPGIIRPRMPVPAGSIIRQQQGQKLPGDIRLQGLDPRMRMLLQQQQQRGMAGVNIPQQQQQQQFSVGSMLRFSQTPNVRATSIEQYEDLLQRQQNAATPFPPRPEQAGTPRPPVLQHQRSVSAEQKTPTTTVATVPQVAPETGNSEQEIPDNVTAELEKLEEESGTMAELQGVSEILGGLGDEDDDILAEMGEHFNILEYADPELDALAGEKTNILDSLDLVEPEPDKDDKKENKSQPKTKVSLPPPPAAINTVSEALKKKELSTSGAHPLLNPQVSSGNLPPPPPLAVTQQLPQQHATGQPIVTPPHQQIYQQMLQQVQQAAALGRPMAPGTKLMSPDGIIGVVTPNNTISLTLPSNYSQRVIGTHLHLQNPKLQMRVGQNPRLVSVGAAGGLHGAPAGLVPNQRLNVGIPPPQPPPPPPPPPYPGPPPPYPGSAPQQQQQQMGMHMGPSPYGSYQPPFGYIQPIHPQGPPLSHHMHRRSLLLEEQPLLLEELLEQEKREQEKQLQNQPPNTTREGQQTSTIPETDSALLSDHDFEKLKADVFNTNNLSGISPAPQNSQSLPSTTVSSVNQARANFINRLASANVGSQWQQANQSRPTPTPTPQPSQPHMQQQQQQQHQQSAVEIPHKIPTFNTNLLPAPPLPPEHIVSEQDKQTQLVYEQWLKHQNVVLGQQLKFYETEVQKLRKIRKSLNSKQRQLRKSGNQLADADASELQRISTEQAVLQKHLETSRKQSKQHLMLIQEYQNKQQNKQQRMGQVQSPLLMNAQSNSPLAHPSSSPIHIGSTPQSPMMSPSASSPMTQHSSPLNSPSPMVTHSPGSNSITNLIQSPTSNMSPVQPSPRIGTPHSQGDSSPGPIQSPSQVCPPPPAPRMTSPQHRRIVTSPLGYSGEMRTGTGQALNQIRFTRQPLDSSGVLQQRVRLTSPGQNFQQRNNTPSPLSSPPPQQINLNQQLMQKQLQQGFSQQQNAEESNVINPQRAAQLLQQQRQLILRQQQLVQQHLASQQQTLTPQQHHLLLQQQQLVKQQQQLQQHMQSQQNRLNQQQGSPAGSSPLPPKSPLLGQIQNIMSPHSIHSQPPSPMPPRSPMVGFNQPPSSPAMPRSPAVSQPPSSPMMHTQHQPPSSPMARSPMMTMRRPPSVENPSTPRPAYNVSDGDHGGGNPHNPINPLPVPPDFRYVKLGLRGGSPMWGGLGRGAKRLPALPDAKEEENKGGESTAQPKMKKESHLSKVSILKKKSPMKTNLQSFAVSKVGSLVSVDYNEFDDSSCTPPVTPPPSTSKAILQKRIAEHIEAKEHVIAATSSPETKPHEEIMDYDDDNDNTVVSTEVSLSSAAQQNDGDDITVIETFSSDLADVMSSPLESDQIADEFVLFPGNMVVDISGEAQYSDKEEDDEEYGGEIVNINDKNMHIVNVAIQSPTTSEEEMIMQGKTKTLNIVQGLPSNHLLTMTEGSESPEHEEMHIHESPDSAEDVLTDFEDSEIVIIDPTVKSPEEQISTKEDFEELIDEGSKKEKIIKSDILNSKHLSEMHKYTSNIYNFPAKVTTSANIVQASSSRLKQVVTQKLPANLSAQPRISLIASPIKNIAASKSAVTKMPELLSRGVKIIPTTVSTSVANIILPLKSTVRTNMTNVSKIVTSVPPAITIVSASTSQIASILPSHFTVPVISASAVSKLPNVKVIDKPSSSLSLTAHDTLPKKIFEDEPVSPDNSNDSKKSAEKKKQEQVDTNKKLATVSKNDHQSNVPENKKEATTAENASNTKNETANITKQSHCQQTMQSSTVVESTGKNNTAESNTTSVLIHGTPELKMTAQIIQETQTGMHVTARGDGSTSFVTSQSLEGLDNSASDLDNKSVVISIPSPTPSQEQMLDNIARQALENRRREGGFESFEDMLSMIENITGESATVLEEAAKADVKMQESTTATKKDEPKCITTTAQQQTPCSTTTSASSVMSQLSPLSQPAELTTNMANVSQQLRTLLSSLHTTTVTTSSNVETVVKSVTQKDKVLISTSSPITAVTTSAKVIQHIEKTPVVSTSTVIVPNFKQKSPHITTAASLRTSSASFSVSSVSTVDNSSLTSQSMQYLPTSVSNLLASRSSGGIQLMPDHPKLPPITTVASAQNVTVQQTKTITTTTSCITTTTPPKSLSLDAMLQSHPAATMPQTSPSTITTASLLGSPLGIIKPGFGSSLAQAHPQVSVPTAATSHQNLHSDVTVTSTVRAIVTTTNLLHTQLTKTMKSNTSENQEASTFDAVKKDEIKAETCVDAIVPNSSSSQVLTTSLSVSRVESSNSIPSTLHTPVNRMEDSQNVLLKQLLQNTACASTASTVTASNTTSTVSTTSPVTPSLPIVPNLEAQLARPVPPISTPLLPPMLQNDSTTTTVKPPQRNIMVSRETSFVSKAVVQNPLISLQQQAPTSQPLHIDTKRCLPPSRTPSRDDLLSPPTPRSTCSQDSNLQTPPLTIKKEITPSVAQQNMLLPLEVKKELVDESSQHSEVSDHSRPDIQMKDELMDLDSSADKNLIEQKEELKKMKRRAYQQKRRQNQILGKDAAVPKKRPRKGSKVEEDYDTYIDGVLHQLRTLPPMTVAEPVLNKNFSVVPIFGCGDLSKLGGKDYDSRCGDLSGTYGDAVVPDTSDFYNTKPYGDAEAMPEKTPASTQRGFYDQEFPLIKFNIDEDKKFDLFCREDSPDSIISSSSPECYTFEPILKFPGLRLISEDEDEEPEEDAAKKMRLSPVVPLIQPIPIRLKCAGPYLKDLAEMENKENIRTNDNLQVKSSKVGPPPSTPSKDSGNVTVTLTLTSSAAEDIMGVLRDLANILHIPAPTSYQIVERTSTPPSQKLGLYRTKGKDGREGAPVDIQSILNGAAKFCRHCDVVILNNMIRKKVSDLPCLNKTNDLMDEDEDLFFCSSACFMQFALIHRSPSITEDKAAAIIDHLCQKDKTDVKAKPADPYDKGQIDADVDLKPFRTHFKSEPIDVYNYESSFRNRTEELKSHSKQGLEKSSQLTRSHRGLRYKFWTPGCLQPSNRVKRPSDKELMELLYRSNITVTPSTSVEDVRKCMFCGIIGDGVADGPARLLNFDVDKWVHLNCGLWSDGVYETISGALMNLENALQQSLLSTCIHCNRLGATIRCFKTRCSNIYHLGCAVKDNCVFYKNKTVYCNQHVQKSEKDNELTTLAVWRRVYVNRDENRQVAAVMHHSDTSNLLRVGSLIFLNVGQLLPHQLQNFHTSSYIYPIGYKIIRFFWSMRHFNKRCRYVCSIHDASGRPEFRIVVQEHAEEDIELRDSSPKAVWNRVLEQIFALRRQGHYIQVFPKYMSGEDLFGLTEPAVVRVLESLPGVETLTDYKFKYGRNPLLELPLAINPSGSARTEPRLRNQLHWKRPHTQRTGSSARPMFASSVGGPVVSGEVSCPYSKQFVHSKSSQYKKMKQEWRNNVYLARSKIQGLGLYAARDLEKHTMVIEYIGEIIRTELAETREKKYEAKNRGIYMFRLDEERVVDATLCGGLARYINHSCNPNCVAEIVEVDRDLRIIIFAKRRIQRGEELAYDYKFDIEDDQHKISCMCGAPNCRKWMN